MQQMYIIIKLQAAFQANEIDKTARRQTLIVPMKKRKKESHSIATKAEWSDITAER